MCFLVVIFFFILSCVYGEWLYYKLVGVIEWC